MDLLAAGLASYAVAGRADDDPGAAGSAGTNAAKQLTWPGRGRGPLAAATVALPARIACWVPADYFWRQDMTSTADPWTA